MTSRKKYKNRPGIYPKIVAFFLFLTIIAIFIIIHFALAKVTIKIYTKVTGSDYSGLVEMLPESILEVSEENILGKLIKKELELTVTVPAEETSSVSNKAGGYVDIINNYSKNQILVATTRLLTPDNKLYRIQEKVNVPAGGQVRAWAEADQPGEQFVIEATTMTIPGLWAGLQDKIYAETTGMSLTSLPVYTVTQESLNQAQEQLQNQAIQQGLADINESLSKQLKIDEQRLFLGYQTLESSELGDRSQTATLKQKVTLYGLVFAEDNLRDITKNKFVNELASDQKLLEFDEASFQYEIIEIYPEREQAVLEVKISANVSSNKHLFEIDKQSLIGLTEEGINAYLSQFKVDRADIDFFPFWVKKVPRFKDHIIIE